MAFTEAEEKKLRSLLTAFDEAQEINDAPEATEDTGNKEVEVYDTETGQGGKMKVSTITKAAVKETGSTDLAETMEGTDSVQIESGGVPQRMTLQNFKKQSGIDGKVDKVEGKQLSTNDFSDEDKTKLNGIEKGAQVNTPVDSELSGSSTNPVQNKVLNAALGQKANGSDLTAHTASKNNPHGVTKAQVGLGNVDNTADKDKPVSAAQKAALDLKADKTEVEAVNKKVSNLYTGSNVFYAAGRVAGAASAAFTKEYGNKGRLQEILSHLKTGLIKNGAQAHEFAPGRCDLDTEGNAVAIDGSDGDVCNFTDVNIYSGRNRGAIGDSTYNFIGLGLAPFQVEGMLSMGYQPFYMSADYTVNCKLEGDVRSQAHCIYNENVAGQYDNPIAFFKQKVKPNGNGYPSQFISSLNASQQARNKNADPNTNTPNQGLFFGWDEIWWQAMYLECGTLDVCDPTVFGYGCTNTAATADTFADTAISGVSGVKLITSGGAATYGGLMSQNLRIGASGSNNYNVGGICGTSWYGFLQNLIHLRIFNNITKYGLTGYVGNSNAVFTDLGSKVVTDGSINLSTGAGMTAGKYYIQVRNGKNCQGIADGVMTGVINIYVMVETNDDVYLSDGKTSMKGGKAIFKFSVNVYRGRAFLKGMFTQLEGLYYRHTNTDGTRRMECWSVDRPENVPVIGNSTGYCDGAEINGMLKGLTLRFMKGTNGGWVSDTDYSVSLFAHYATSGGQHSMECACLWNDTSWGYGNGYPSQGKSCTNASVSGCGAVHVSAGRSLYAIVSATIGDAFYAGAFAGILRVAKAA